MAIITQTLHRFLILTILIWLALANAVFAGEHMDLFNALDYKERCKRLAGMYSWGALARNQGAGRGVKDTAGLISSRQFRDHVWVQHFDKLDPDFQALMSGTVDLGWVAVDEMIKAEIARLEQEHIDKGEPEWVGKINAPPLLQRQIGEIVQEFHEICIDQATEGAKRRI